MGAKDQCCYREQLAFSFYSIFREPKLFRMAVRGDWNRIPSRCRSHPREASFRHKYPPNETTLHVLLKPCLPCEDKRGLDLSETCLIEAVQALLGVSRQHAATTDALGRTALHVACSFGASSKLLRLLVEASPPTVSQVDVEGRTPLHYVLAQSPVINTSVLRLLVEAGPEALSIKDSNGETPIDIAQRRVSELVNAREVLECLGVVPDDHTMKPRRPRVLTTSGES